ncbi:hypothetical protein M426DRAFT_122162 [Hypoxylon sp. CI-4A]|nr:hypothetical protein M426DRAFT_122162 [Hypoxylon sp. CI-4A]
MNASVNIGRKFEGWPDDVSSQWNPAMFTSPFNETIPVADSQFWTGSGNSSEYCERSPQTTREDLGQGLDASDNYDAGFTIDNAVTGTNPRISTYAYDPSQFIGQSEQIQTNNPVSAQTKPFEGASSANTIFNNSISTADTHLSSRSPEVISFSPQSILVVSPGSSSSANWMPDETRSHLSPQSPGSNINAILDPAASSPPPPTGMKHKRNRERNRVAAHKCRQKAKQSMSNLQIRERELSRENRALHQAAGSLRDEILDLKNEILRHSDCNSDVIQKYISRAARDIT